MISNSSFLAKNEHPPVPRTGLIDDEQAWIALLNARNQTSHLYDDATAQEFTDYVLDTIAKL